MSPEVEIAALKVEVEHLKDDVRRLTEKVEELLQAAQWGRGAGWVLIKAGVVLVGLASIAKVVWDVVRHP